MLDLTALTPKASQLDSRAGGAGRPAGANPFVDNGWLQASRETAQEVSVKASQVAEVVNAIRNAANRLNIGVTVQVVVDGNRYDDVESMSFLRVLPKVITGEVPEGWTAEAVKEAKTWARKNATVKYQAKDRKQRKAKAAE